MIEKLLTEPKPYISPVRQRFDQRTQSLSLHWFSQLSLDEINQQIAEYYQDIQANNYSLFIDLETLSSNRTFQFEQNTINPDSLPQISTPIRRLSYYSPEARICILPAKSVSDTSMIGLVQPLPLTSSARKLVMTTIHIPIPAPTPQTEIISPLPVPTSPLILSPTHQINPLSGFIQN